jgi:hypothetical protein
MDQAFLVMMECVDRPSMLLPNQSIDRSIWKGVN